MHDLIVPLVQDPDLDPFLSTGIELRRGDDVIAQLGPGSDDAHLDAQAEILTFTIRSLPVGDYELFTTSGDFCTLIATGIQVKKKGIFFGGKALRDTSAPLDREEITFVEKPLPAEEFLDPPHC